MSLLFTPDTYLRNSAEVVLCNNIGYPPDCLAAFGKPAHAKEVAQRIITSTAHRMYDIWYPDNQYVWWIKLMHHLWPERLENFKNFFPKSK